MKVYRSSKSGEQIAQTYAELLKKWNTEYLERDIATKYGSTHVIECGTGDRALILLHGVGDDSALMWIYNAQALAQEFHIYALDTLGGPGMSRPNDNYNKEFSSVDWIDATLDGIGVDKVCMAGVSNGAYLAQLYAVSRPERVLKIVCMAGTLPIGEGSPLKTMMKVFMPEALFPTKRNTEKLIRKLSGARPNVFLDDECIMRHYQWLLKGFNNMSMSRQTTKRFTKEQAESLRDKAFYIVGGRDPFQLMGGRKLLEDFNMNKRVIEDAGHGINHEYADIINKLLIETLKPAYDC